MGLDGTWKELKRMVGSLGLGKTTRGGRDVPRKPVTSKQRNNFSPGNDWHFGVGGALGT